MKFNVAVTATLAAFVGNAVAQLSIITPGGPDLWWVASSINTLSWTCQTSPYQTFTVLIANSNPTIQSAPQAIIAIENNFDCSKTITQDQSNQVAATGYTIQLANPLNNTDIYAESQPFEIKAVGSAYPASSATPTATGTNTASSNSSATVTGTNAAAASTTGASTKNDAMRLTTSIGGIAAVAAAFGLMFA
ncbi:hypothetical protein A0H81_02479 [Grifola frondosa]|uniref:Uncharacterized protein n=1 Tax=Grifola frondosa TaxID=5627 RepID=A0A1C7MP59_GRIFR|nr:hypothetical protein A0H81_02479 [Grifola frondosa]